MKIIPKFQQGGGYDSFFTKYPSSQRSSRQASTGSSQSTKSSSTKDDDDDDEKGQVTQKDLLNMIKDIDGLPNEMNLIAKDLLNAFKVAKIQGKAADISSLYIRSLMKIKQATANKEEFTEVVKQGIKDGIMNEIAIAPNGDVMVQDKESGELTAMNIKEFSKNSSKYKLLTNSNIAWLRKNDPNYAYNDTLRDILNNGMSFKLFQDLVDKAKTSLGSSETDIQGYINASDQNSAVQGLSVLKSLSEAGSLQAQGSISIQGLYQYDLVTKQQANQIKSLIDYMKKVLPQNAKTWASIKTNVSDPDEALESLLIKYLGSQENPLYKFHIDYKGTEEKLTKGGSGDGSSKNEPDMTFLTALQFGYGSGREDRSMNLGGNANTTVNGTYYGAILGQDQKTLYDSNLNDMLMKSGIAGISNMNSITFGDNIVSSNSFQYIAVENNGGFLTILPCKRSGTTVTPDFELARSFEKLVQDVIKEAGPNGTLEERERLLSEKMIQSPELQHLLDMSGKLDQDKFASFFIVDGLASDLNINLVTRNQSGNVVSISDSSSPFIRETKSEDAINYFKKVTSPVDFDDDDSWFEGGYSKVYRGNIFIPIQTNNRMAAILFSGQTIKDSKGMEIQTEYLRSNTGMKNTSTNLLGL